MSVHRPVLGHPIPVTGFGIPDQAGSYRTSRQDRRNRLPSFKNIPPDSGGKDGNAERIREKKKKASALKKAENRQNEIDRLFAKMYEDRACEKITERNFIMLSGKYQKEQIELEQQITNLREELSKMEQDMIGAEKWIELIKEYSVPKELTAPLLNAMIEKILIHEATTNEENERIQEIEIYYRFIGKVD